MFDLGCSPPTPFFLSLFLPLFCMTGRCYATKPSSFLLEVFCTQRWPRMLLRIWRSLWSMGDHWLALVCVILYIEAMKLGTLARGLANVLRSFGFSVANFKFEGAVYLFRAPVLYLGQRTVVLGFSAPCYPQVLLSFWKPLCSMINHWLALVRVKQNGSRRSSSWTCRSASVV